MSGLLFLVGLAVVGVLLYAFLDYKFLFEITLSLLLLGGVIYTRFSDAKWYFGKKKPGQWFSRTPGDKTYPAYTPRSWQGWLIFLAYFASFVAMPVWLSSLIRVETPLGFTGLIVVSMIITTILYLFIASKKS